ncbi:NADH-quinone oxidoreductase subunit M [Aquisalinus flavus]|uniref:NADH-quinone oxidoreductase subunit M n=1 Tax=Aquisalinus flavus TaxID=1526572 RepID=A0A8J2Y662_9PROT|nr:NADH-quinone oxidoreductase subunit M [Aquisalinus flavus]MBD0426665.1 NADH-quinone oxidoreductase subunit M [Aquisalinus flavus]UNE47793.1 NADH-quinone oxidoreductase subunit M [Aquisalinus flavus]GGD06035.1 NADH-quinone oxidoreductase subunit M [Aquisalinus flavus]
MTESFIDQPWLSFTTFLPIFGALLIVLRRLLSRGDETALVDNAARWVALLTTVVTFIVSLVVYVFYDPSLQGFQLVEEMDWLGSGISYKMGVDGASILFVLLTTFIMPICILASWNSVTKRVADYMIAFLVLETLMIGVFCALDLVLFYVFFEASLIPMFLIIGIWGSEGERTFMGAIVKNRIYATFKFFLYTLLGSLLMLIALVWMYMEAGTTDVVALQTYDFPVGAQNWLWLAFFASFAVKMPMWPVHTWLPDAHVQAPTAGSVVLAAILLKMGGYGFVRFSLPMFPLASDFFAPFVFTLSAIAIVYTSLVAFAQEDMKKLIAYSSVAHMGFVTMGLFTATEQGIEGALFQMLSHGFISGALFLCVGVVYDRLHTRQIAAYGGLVKHMKWYSFFFLFFTMGNVGLPGVSGFVGEMLTLVGAYKVSTWTAAVATLGLIFSAAYGLRLYREVVFGTVHNEQVLTMPDLGKREWGMLAVLAIMALWLGVNPSPTLEVFSPAVDSVLGRYDAALAAAGR